MQSQRLPTRTQDWEERGGGGGGDLAMGRLADRVGQQRHRSWLHVLVIVTDRFTFLTGIDRLSSAAAHLLKGWKGATGTECGGITLLYTRCLVFAQGSRTAYVRRVRI